MLEGLAGLGLGSLQPSSATTGNTVAASSGNDVDATTGDAVAGPAAGSQADSRPHPDAVSLLQKKMLRALQNHAARLSPDQITSVVDALTRLGWSAPSRVWCNLHHSMGQGLNSMSGHNVAQLLFSLAAYEAMHAAAQQAEQAVQQLKAEGPQAGVVQLVGPAVAAAVATSAGSGPQCIDEPQHASITAEAQQSAGESVLSRTAGSVAGTAIRSVADRAAESVEHVGARPGSRSVSHLPSKAWMDRALARIAGKSSAPLLHAASYVLCGLGSNCQQQSLQHRMTSCPVSSAPCRQCHGVLHAFRSCFAAWPCCSIQTGNALA